MLSLLRQYCNLEVPERNIVFQIAFGVNLPSFDPVEEFEALFNNNLSFAVCSSRVKSRTLTDSWYASLEVFTKDKYWSIPKVSSAAAIRKITQSFGWSIY